MTTRLVVQMTMELGTENIEKARDTVQRFVRIHNVDEYQLNGVLVKIDTGSVQITQEG